MSYQVLARKWRPRSFATLVGQDHVVRALTHALKEGRLHHAYLFTGTRGVGKTTIARLLAKALNCEIGVSDLPCGVCDACKEIDSGRFVDLLEVDAATNTRVDEMRQLLENAVYAPTRGRYKVYVIDEVHMLSSAAFNAMLKTLEEPPDHVKFILATTDPQKIPVTVLSRCLQFNLKQVTQPAIASHLLMVLAKEGVRAEESALVAIARAANGSMRDALSLLDQAIAFCGGEISSVGVSEMLGTLGDDYLLAIFDAIAIGNPRLLSEVADRLALRAISYDSALAALAEALVQVQAIQLGCAAEELVLQRLGKYAEGFSVDFVQLAYGLLIQGRAQMAYAPDPHAGFLMALLRLCAFKPSESSVGEKKKSLTHGAIHEEQLNQPAGDPGLQFRAKQHIAGEVKKDQAAVQVECAPRVVDWGSLLAELPLQGLAREMASHCEWCGVESSTLRLRLAREHRHLLNRTSQERLQSAIYGWRGITGLVIEIDDIVAETPALVASRRRAVAHDQALEAIERDPEIRELIEIFDASLIESSIRALAAQEVLSGGIDAALPLRQGDGV